MGRYLALLLGAAAPQEKANVPEDVSERLLQAWGTWQANHADSVVESGGPLGPNLRVSGDRTEPVGNRLVAWMIVEAESVDDAAGIFVDHPHVSLMRGNAVDVMELLAAPTG